MNNTIIRDDIEYIIRSLPAEEWNALSAKTILVAGANGFLPAYMVETLLSLSEQGIIQDTKIIALVRDEKKAFTRFPSYLSRKDLSILVQDIAQSFTIPGAVDHIIHAASQASPKYYGSDPVGTLNANVLGTNNLLSIAREKGSASFFYFSSGEVYGEVEEKSNPIKEQTYGYLDPMNVRSCYAESKRMGETMCISWSHQYGIPVKIVRPFHTYGPGMRLDDGRVFADFVADIVQNRNIVMKSDGSALRSFCYLADATAGFFTVLLRGRNREAYNIGNSDVEVSVLQLATILTGLFPERGLSVVRQQGSTTSTYLKSTVNRACPDISKARSLGWSPRYSLKEGFTRTIRSFMQ